MRAESRSDWPHAREQGLLGRAHGRSCPIWANMGSSYITFIYYNLITFIYYNLVIHYNLSTEGLLNYVDGEPRLIHKQGEGVWWEEKGFYQGSNPTWPPYIPWIQFTTFSSPWIKSNTKHSFRITLFISNDSLFISKHGCRVTAQSLHHISIFELPGIRHQYVMSDLM